MPKPATTATADWTLTASTFNQNDPICHIASPISGRTTADSSVEDDLSVPCLKDLELLTQGSLAAASIYWEEAHYELCEVEIDHFCRLYLLLRDARPSLL